MQPNTPVFYYRDRGDKFYVILEGEVNVILPKSQDEIDELTRIPFSDVSHHINTRGTLKQKILSI